MTMNEQIVRYADRKLGRKDGNGQCWTLAKNALADAGAVIPTGHGAALYVWGTRVADASNLRPGNIIQFTSYAVTITQTDGSYYTMERGQPRHTAIVESVGSNGQVTVFEANVDETMNTVRTVLYLEDATIDGATVEVSGSFVLYQAVARE